MRADNFTSLIRSRRALLLLGFLITAITPVKAERLPIKIYTTADGLVSNRVSRIVPDSRGYLWFCTEQGLSRFDGYRFANYTTEQGLPDNEVNDLLETGGGDYWVATGKGLCRFNPKGSPLKEHQAAQDSEPMFVVYRPGEDRGESAIKSLYEDSAGAIWCGTWRGLYRVSQIAGQVSFQFIDLGMPQNAPETRVVRNILEDRQARLWITTDSGLYRRLPDGRCERFTTRHGLASERLMGLVEDRQGRLWVGDRFGGLCQLVSEPDVSRTVVARYYSTRDGLGCISIASLFESRDGRFWIGTDCGLSELLDEPEKADQGIRGFLRIRGFLGADVLANPDVWSLAEDRQGNLWVGSPNGAVRVTRSGFTTYTEADGLGARESSFIFESHMGELLVQTRSPRQAFISRFDGRRFVPTDLKLPNLSDPPNWEIKQGREGRWWLITTDGLWRFPESESFIGVANLRPEAFYTIRHKSRSTRGFFAHEDSRGDAWMSTDDKRLIRWERATGRLHNYSGELPPTLSVANEFAEDRAGNMWFAFSEHGLVRFANNRFNLFTSGDGIPGGVIRRLFIDSRGRLWIATSQGGLGRIDDPTADRPQVARYTPAEGLSSDDVYSIVEDRWGRLYIGTTNGLDRLDPATGRIKHFTTADGLANNHVITGLLDRHGALWFGTDTGLSRLIPEPDNPQPPQPVFIGRLEIPGSGYRVSELGESDVRGLELGPSQNNIQINFFGLPTASGDALGYQYKLEAIDEEWSQLTNRREVNYVSLAPGSYRFLVRAVNGDGVASLAPASFSFTILAPVWQRWWFITIAAALAGLLFYSLYRYRVARLIEIERVRMRIAADLHDDIGSSLSQIAVLSEVLRKQLGAQEAGVSKNLSLINRVSQEALDSMSDIVWAINPQQDHLSDLVRRMRRVASEILPARNIEFSFDAPPAGHDLKLGADIRRQVFLMFKEAINNTVRHSGCHRAEICMKVDGAWLALSVADDGKGFDPDRTGEGNGLVSLRRRASSLGGETVISSRAGKGTTVTIKIPHSHRASVRIGERPAANGAAPRE
jgi:ligand-binding sensor domain-containing protein/signal transduction histidine kinase